MKHHLRGRRAVLEGDVQLFGRQEFISNVPKSMLLDKERKTRFETRADKMLMMMGRRSSACCGRCCRPRIGRYQVTV